MTTYAARPTPEATRAAYPLTGHLMNFEVFNVDTGATVKTGFVYREHAEAEAAKLSA